MSASTESGVPTPPPSRRTTSSTRRDAPLAASDRDSTLPAGATPSAASPRGRLGAYEVLCRLGSGGMGEVLAVVDQALERTVAAKVMRGAASDLERRRFLAEARITGELEHPNIVPVHTLVAEPGGPLFFTMKHVQGEDLVARLARIRGEEERGARRVGGSLRELLIAYLKIIDAVGFAHAHGIVHRDLKPANVMCGEHGEVYVCDWGLAKRFGNDDPSAEPSGSTDARDADPLATQDGTVVGTPSYMSPEQARGEVDRPDPRSDVYGLGAILYELLAFEPPYKGATALETIELVDVGPPVPPRMRSPARDIPRELEAIVQKAMARDPAHRYVDARALREDVEAFLDGGFIGAARYGPREALAKLVRRHRMAAAAVLAVALTASAFALQRGWDRHVALRQRAEQIAVARRTLERLAPESVLEAARALVRDAPPGLVAKEIAPTFAQRGAQLDLLRALKGVADAAGEVVVADPAAAAERAVAEEALLALSALACLGGDHGLAEFALGQARALGADPGRLASADRALAADRLALRTRQRERIEARLVAARSGALVDGSELARATIELAGINEPETALAMARALDELSAPLRRAIEDALGDVARATDVELAQGERAIEGLDVIIPAWIDSWRWAGEPPGVGLAGEQLATLERALARCEARAARAILATGAKGASPRWIELLGRAQTAALPGGSDARTVELASAVLGELGSSSVAVQALARYLLLEHDHARAVAAGRALARLAGRDALAERALLAFVGAIDVPHALRKWELGGAWWAQVRASYRPSAAPAEASLTPDEPARLAAVLDLGNAALARRDYGAALAAFTDALALAPGNGRAHHGRAITYLQRGDFERALEEVERALAVLADAASVHLVRASVLRRLGRVDLARAAFARALELAPDDPATLVERAKLLRERGDLAGALLDLDRALAKDPRRTQAYAERGRLRLESGQYALALADYDQALGLSPDDSDALVGRSNARVETGNLEGALADIDRAVGVDPTNSRAYGNRGRIRLLRGELEAASADLDRALELDPSYVKALINRSSSWRLRKDYARARADLDRAIGLAPEQAELYAYRGALLAEQGRHDEARADLDHALALAPDSVVVLMERGKHCALRGDVAGAERDFGRAVALAPQDANAWWNLAQLAAGAGDYARARAHLDRAIEAAPRSPELLATRGEVLARLGDHAAALTDFERALAMNGRLWQVECLAGTSLVALGRTDDARRAFERARASVPEAQAPTVERMRAAALGR